MFVVTEEATEEWRENREGYDEKVGNSLVAGICQTCPMLLLWSVS